MYHMVNRIKILMNYKSLNPNDFANEIGVSKSTISHVFSGRNNPSLDVVSNILNRFPDVSSEWLLRGVGDMFLSQHTNENIFVNNEKTDENALNTNKNISLESINQHKEELTNRLIQNENTIDYNCNKESIKKNTNEEYDKINSYEIEKNQENNDFTNVISSQELKKQDLSKCIRKIVIFYDDNSFEAYNPQM